jgi:hypothetical protein
MGEIVHNKKHNIDSTVDHTGVSGATQGNMVSFDVNGLIEDSGVLGSDVNTHLSASNPHSGSAASGANGDITSFSNLTGNISDGTDTVTVSKIAGSIKGAMVFIVDGGGAVLTTGKKNATYELPYMGTITRATIISKKNGAPLVGSVDVHVYKNGTKISGTDPISLSSASEVNKTSFTGWTLTGTANDEYSIEITGTPSTVEYITVQLHFNKTGI